MFTVARPVEEGVQAHNEAEGLVALINSHEDWLMRRVLEYARAHGYTKYTSTLLEAWRMSVSGLSASLVAGFSAPGNKEFGPEEDFTSDPMARFGCMEARRHRQRGVTLSMFLGLMKYYRQAYTDLVCSEVEAPQDRESYRRLIERGFDRIEIAFCQEWAANERDPLVVELQTTNRQMTNLKNCYLTVFESLADPVLLLDESLRIVNLNYAAALLHDSQTVPGAAYYRPRPQGTSETQACEGVTPADRSAMLGRAVLDLFPWLSEVLAEGDRVSDGVAGNEAKAVVHGRSICFEVKCSSMLDFSGKFVATVVLLRDISDQKRAQEELHRHIGEIERFNRLAIGREQRILELKHHVNELALAAARSPVYAVDRTDLDNDPSGGDQRPDDDDKEFTDRASVWHELADLIDCGLMRPLLDNFCDSVGIASAIIDFEGKVLIGSRWQRVCTEFHRGNPRTCERCIRSDTVLARQLKEGEQFAVYQCGNGLTDAASPIVIEGRQVANAFVGQFLLEPADEAFFRRQAAECGFDEGAYLEAVREVPVIPREKLPAILGFLTSVAEVMGGLGLERLRQKEAERSLARRALELDARNRELRMQRSAAMSLAEDAERAQAALKESEEKFRNLVETTSDWIWETDADGAYTYASPRVHDLLGYTPEEIIGKRPWELMPPDEAEHFSAEFKQAASCKSAFSGLANVNIGKDGRRVLLESSGVPRLNEAGSLLGYRGIDRDISERRKAEAVRERLVAELEMKNKDMESLVYAVSHDLRSPLVNILGFSQELDYACASLREGLTGEGQEQRDDEQLRRILDEQIPMAMRFITSSGKRIEQLIDGMLLLCRAGRTQLKAESIDMNDLVGTAVDAMAYQTEKCSASIEVDDLPPCFGDAGQISQVFSNLLDNALKYRDPDRPLRIRVSGERNRDHIEYRVEDNGRGIAPQYHERIWELFHRLHPEAAVAGEGLGLTLTRKIVQRHGGRIWLESQPGEGSTFHVVLPIRFLDGR